MLDDTGSTPTPCSPRSPPAPRWRPSASEHTAAADDHDVWGVPTFIQGDQAVFVRLMDRPRGDGDVATRTIDRVVDLLGDFPELNEFKHTSLKR